MPPPSWKALNQRGVLTNSPASSQTKPVCLRGRVEGEQREKRQRYGSSTAAGGT